MNLPDTIKMNRSLFSDFFRDLDDFFGTSSVVPSMSGESFLNPFVDVDEDEQNYILSFEVPGVSPEDIKIDVTNNLLTVSGERRQEMNDERRKMTSRRYGSFRRSYTLPPGISSDEVQASYENGVLEVMIPKSGDQHKRNIEIQHGRSYRKVLSGDQAKSEQAKQSQQKSAKSEASKESQPRH